MNDTLKDAIALTIMTAVLLLGASIYFFTLYLAYLTSFGSLLLTLFIPDLGQLFWLWIVWGTNRRLLQLVHDRVPGLAWSGRSEFGRSGKDLNRRAMISREALLDKDHDRFWASCGGDCGRLRRPRAGVPVTPSSLEACRAALGLAAAVTPPLNGMLLSSEPFCVHELFGLPDHIDQAGAAQGAGAGADVAPRRSPTHLESNVTAGRRRSRSEDL